MPLLTSIMTFVGIPLLTHAIYSAYEHALLGSRTASTTYLKRLSIPIDIVFETLLATGILLVATVLNAAPLRPIHWGEWAGKIEREGWDPNAAPGEEKKIRKGRGATGNPYRALEERRGFWDARAARRDFAEWAKSKDEGGVQAKSRPS